MTRSPRRRVKDLTVRATLTLATAWGVTLAAPARAQSFGDAGGSSNRELQLQRERQLRELDQFNVGRTRPNELIPVGQRALVDYGAFVTVAYLTTKDADGQSRGLRIYEAVGYARVNIDSVHEFFVRGRYTYNDYFYDADQSNRFDGPKDDSYDGRGSRENRDKLDRAFYRFDLGRYMQAYQGKSGDPGLAIQGGRDLVYWANGLVLGRRLDGIVVDLNSGPLSVQAIAGVTPEDTVDFDTTRPKYDIDTRRGFYGAIATYDAGAHKPFIYFLSQRDYNDSGPYSDNRAIEPGSDPLSPTPRQVKFRYDSYYIGLGSTGNLGDRVLYAVEAAYEGGTALASPYNTLSSDSFNFQSQESENIRAFALNARLEYLVPDDRLTRFTLEQTFASGDRDRISSSSDTVFGNTRGTTDAAFNAFGLINPGLAFNPNLANLSITRLGASTFPLRQFTPTRRLQVGVDVFIYNLIQKQSVIDEQTTGDGRFLGFEPDLYLNWQATSDITLTLRYGIFFPSDNLSANIEDRQFFYAGVTYAF